MNKKRVKFEKDSKSKVCLFFKFVIFLLLFLEEKNKA